MRLMITAESAGTGERHDAVVDVTAQTTVGELAGALDPRMRQRDATPAAFPGDNVIALRRDVTPSTTDLWLGGRRLDPDDDLESAGIRHGMVLGLGGPSSHQEHEPSGVAEITVCSGPGAGRVFRLGAGTSRLGSGDDCGIRIEDVPAVVAELEVDRDGVVTIVPDQSVADRERSIPIRRDQPTEPIVLQASSVTTPTSRRRRRKKGTTLEVGERIDPTSPIPELHVDRRRITGRTPWEAGQVLGAGPVLLELREASAPDASLSPSPSRPELDYNRPPRLHPAPRQNEFSLPGEPRRPDKMPIPWPMMMMPLMMSGASFAITRSPFSLIFMALMPMMMLVNFTAGRRQQKRRYLTQLEEYHRKHVEIESAAVNALQTERAHRRSVHPDPAAALLFATGPRARLWERRRWDPDFLSLRLGTADVPSDVVVKDPGRLAHEGPLRWTAPDVPVVVDLSAQRVIGLAGTAAQCRRTAAWLVAQVATLHSPVDAPVWILAAGPDHAADESDPGWEWAKWLPHVRADDGHPHPVRIAHSEAHRTAAITQIGQIVDHRMSLDDKVRATQPHLVVVLDGARELRMEPGVISLLKNGPAANIEFICLDRSVHHLPEECRSVVVHRDGAVDLSTSAQAHVDAIRPDVVDTIWLDRLARALAPVRDVSTEDPEGSVPAASRLLEVLGLDQVDAAAITGRWGPDGSTRAVIGEASDGPFAIDIRADGPHGLVAGTTGSGKSELLQTIIASLAVTNRPDQFTFILIDYKGGAAFKDCRHLPHTVGMVTDLDGHLTERALESLGAELHHRERMLANADAKDIEDYTAGRGPDDEPMPRLLIVIDEFAALVAELPDFVTGLVDVARRGRSLGVHLILATQRPAGVVNAEIKSNTNLRIALRVTDTGDSDDVVEAPVAAHIPPSLPGRAYARRGHSSLVAFQSSRVGGRPASTERAELAPAPFDWDTLGARRATAAAEDDVSTPTDLATLVAAIRGARDEIGLSDVRSPWLEPLPTEVLLDDLDLAAPRIGTVPPIRIGRSDLPHLQQQLDESWDLARGSHLMIAGQSRSGRSTALRTIAASIARQCAPHDVHVFAIDAGNNALLPLQGLPHVGAVVTRTQVDRVYRLLGFLGTELARRQQLLAEQGFADIAEQRAAVDGEDRLPYLVVLLDRLEGYVAAFESIDGGVLVDRLQAFLQEGAGVGIRLVITADRSGLIGRVSSLVEDRIALSLNDPADYSTIGLMSKKVPASMPPGRAFRTGERPRELQWALLAAGGTGTEQVAAIHQIARDAQQRWTELPRALRPQRIDELPTTISAAEAAELEVASSSRTFVGVGIGGDSLAWHGFDPPRDGSGFLVAGPPRSGRSTALVGIVDQFTRQGRSVVVIAPRISPLRELDGRRVTVLDGSDLAAVQRAVEAVRRDRVIVVDDLEVLGMDSPVAGYLAEQLTAMRDTAGALVVGASTDEASAVYRGLVAELKRRRCGLLLAPRSSSDGELLNARLPRSVGTPVPAGRAILTNAGGWRWVQVPRR